VQFEDLKNQLRKKAETYFEGNPAAVDAFVEWVLSMAEQEAPRRRSALMRKLFGIEPHGKISLTGPALEAAAILKRAMKAEICLSDLGSGEALRKLDRTLGEQRMGTVAYANRFEKQDIKQFSGTLYNQPDRPVKTETRTEKRHAQDFIEKVAWRIKDLEGKWPGYTRASVYEPHKNGPIILGCGVELIETAVTVILWPRNAPSRHVIAMVLKRLRLPKRKHGNHFP
jgi:hypothetical protein